MRPTVPVLALAVAFAAPAAQADERPTEGGYMLVDTVLDGVAAGAIVPIYTHMALTATPDGGHMEFTFFTSYAGDALSCKQQQKCQRAINALGLDFTEGDDGRLALGNVDIRTGPGLTIDRADVDAPYIIQPMLALVDGAQVTWSPDEIVLAPQGWPAGRTARFLPASLDDTYDALAFARTFEVSLGQLDHCVVRQVMEIASRPALFRSAADREVLDAVHVAGLYTRLDDHLSYWAYGDEDDPRDPAAVQGLRDRIMMLRMALAYVRYQEGEDSAAAIDEGIAILSDRIDGFDAIRADLILPNIEAIAAMRSLLARFAEVVAEGYDPVTALCQSVHLDM